LGGVYFGWGVKMNFIWIAFIIYPLCFNGQTINENLTNQFRYYKQINEIDSAILISKTIINLENTETIDKVEFSAILNEISNFYFENNEYKKAEELCVKVLNFRQKYLGENNDLYAASLNNLGNIYLAKNQYEKAKYYYETAASIIKKIHGDNDILYAACLNNIALVSPQKDAINLHLTSLKIYQKKFGKNHIECASSYSFIGNQYSLTSDKNDLYQSEKYFIKALKIYEKNKMVLCRDYAYNLIYLGALYFKLDDFDYAEDYLQEGIEILNKLKLSNSPDYSFALTHLFSIYNSNGNYKSANELLIKKYNIEIQLLKRLVFWLGSSELKKNWFENYNFFRSIWNYSNFSETNILQTLYNSSLFSKSLLLETSRELDLAISSSSDQLLKDQFSEMKQLRRLVTKMQAEGSDKKEIIESYEQQADSLDKILVNKVGEYANAKRMFEITWKDVQACLSSTECAIEFGRYYDDGVDKYVAIVVRPGYEYPKLVKLGSELNIKNSSSQKEFSELYNYVWKGIDSLLTGVKTIYYSPVGELNNVSFSALMSETNNQTDSTKSNWSYLIDRYDLHQVTTTRYLADGTLKKNESIPLSIKLIGGVNYSDLPLSKDSVYVNETTEDFALQINLQNEMNDSKSNRGGKINYLKGSEIEVKEIAKTLKKSGWETTISDGKNAGEYQFKQEMNLKSPGIIHIATHGFAFPEKETKEENGFQIKETATYKVSEDPMVRCGLMLSGANVSWSGDSKKMIETTGDDGILTAAEVANLDLSNTKLVVLSACETGLGKIESSEGTFGLKRGFKLAGVDQIIVSLWKVPDTESMELMTLFYSDLAKTNNPEVSFNFAQKAMRNKFPYEPEKWAVFVLVR
jgi:CHAT domain-containing protein